jgi:hypothetical protein
MQASGIATMVYRYRDWVSIAGNTMLAAASAQGSAAVQPTRPGVRHFLITPTSPVTMTARNIGPVK